MKIPSSLWQNLCSQENLELAFYKARKHKTRRKEIIEFGKNWEQNLADLREELLLQTYNPRPLKTFILQDPKTRKISKSDFRDRIVHHALVNIIESIFEKIFIYDSCANRKGKGTLFAIKRFEKFQRKITKNFTRQTFCLKSDVKHYFEEVDHEILLKIIRKKIKDEKIVWLISRILKSHYSNKGMPLGNLTSQFFANVYLNELDQYIKRTLRAKYYIRYVDDFVILDNSISKLVLLKYLIENFQEPI